MADLGFFSEEDRGWRKTGGAQWCSGSEVRDIGGV